MSLVLDGSNGLTYPNGATNGGFINSSTAVTSTSGTAITFTGIPSWAKRITVMFNSVSTNGTSQWLVQLGTSGGFVTSGYAGSSNFDGSTNQYTAGIGINVQRASDQLNGNLTITLLNSSTNVWSASGNFGNSGGADYWSTGSSVTLSGVATQVRLTTSGGTDTFDLGSINILYE